jgi:hypothetical protein
MYIASHNVQETTANKTIIGNVGFQVLTAVVMIVAIFWDTAPCSPYVNRRFEGTYHQRTAPSLRISKP